MLAADLAGERVAVWGAGVEGRAALAFVARHCRPAELFAVVDGHAPETGSVLADDREFGVWSSSAPVSPLDAATIVVKSPGVSPYHGPLAELRARRGAALRVTGGTQLWFAEAAARGWLGQTIGVTGSKGKSTTSSLIAHLLAVFAERVTLAGNVGRAPLDLLDEALANPATSVHPVVLELSSFQSAEVGHSPGIGVLTTLFPEHLDWHETTERYYADKCNLFAHGVFATVANLANPDVAGCAHRLPNMVGYGVSGGVHVQHDAIVGIGTEPLVRLNDIALRGVHNALNVCGAITAIQEFGIDLRTEHNRAALVECMATFRPLAHRLEPVGELHGRLVVDDSLSTAPQAAVAALDAYADRPVAIIIGGHDRGLGYEALADAVANRTQPCAVLGVPQSGERILALIERAAAGNPLVLCRLFTDFDDAVAAAPGAVPHGGVILLSPAAPSFGRFADYRARGLHFRRLLGLAE